MPQRAWSDKRERQYDHIKEGLLEQGEDEDTAEEIAARTVNKERARTGEAKESSRSSTEDISSSRRGGLRSHRGPGGPTNDQLYNEAREKGIEGRSKMNKAQLERAVGRWRGATMATTKQVQAAKRNIKKARAGAQKKRSIANMSAKTRTALGKQGAAVAKRTGGTSPKTRQELYDEAKRRDLPGRSKMGRDELARALGHK